MKIVSWNVNGLRAVYKKGFIDILKNSEADIFCLQEIKALTEQLPPELLDIPGYTSFFFPAVRKGYSGVAVYSREKPLSTVKGIGVEEFDIEGRAVTLEYEKFYLINTYVPNAQHELKRIEYRNSFNDSLKNYMLELQKTKPVILCGDLNVAHQPIDLKNPKANEKNPGYSPEERQKFTELLNAGFVDIFRKLYPDKIEYSWWSYRFKAREKNIGWRIDYFVISESLVNQVVDNIINADIMGSDHCPVTLELSLSF